MTERRHQATLSDDELSRQLAALAHSEEVSPRFASQVMRSIAEPVRRGLWQRMLDTFAPTVPHRRRVAALALLPAGAAALSVALVLWLASPSVASHDNGALPMHGDLLPASFSIYAPGARTVFLAGDFNGWVPNKLRLRDDDRNGTWNAVLHLPPGRYGYVFWVDGKRVLTPNRERVTDARRGEHSVVEVVANRLRMALPEGGTDVYASALARLTASLRNLPAARVFDTRRCAHISGIRVVNGRAAADELELVHTDGARFSSLRRRFQPGATTMAVADGRHFRAGDRLLISDLRRAHLVTLRDVRRHDGAWQLELSRDVVCVQDARVAPYEPGGFVFKANAGRVYVRDGQLMFDADGEGGDAPIVLAGGVEDFQVALGIDRDRDGLLVETRTAGDEWLFNHAADQPPDHTETPRAVRLTIVARSATRGMTEAIQIEDHLLPAAPAKSRRRVVSLTVAMRNLETSR